MSESDQTVYHYPEHTGERDYKQIISSNHTGITVLTKEHAVSYSVEEHPQRRRKEDRNNLVPVRTIQSIMTRVKHLPAASQTCTQQPEQ